MRIGIDAKWYFDGPPSGRRVVRNLVDHLLKMDFENEYVIFLRRGDKNTDFPPGKRSRVNLCYVWAGNNLLSNVFFLPYYASRYRLDAILYQNFISPFGRAKKIVYNHDVKFLSNPEYYTLLERLYFSPMKWLTRISDAVITVSESEKEGLLKNGFAKVPEMIRVIHHGVEINFRPRERWDPLELERVRHKFNLPEKYLLFVGRLNLIKNIDNLLKAIAMLKDKGIPLVIVGADSWKNSNYKLVIEELGIQDRIQFTGAVDQDLDAIYAMASVFCFPSFAESFGMPPLEAMASGIPVVVSNTTSLPEVCGAAGTYIHPNQPGEIASAIDNLLTDVHLYEQKKGLGLEQAKKFTWEGTAKAVLDCIRSSLRNRPIEKAD